MPTKECAGEHADELSRLIEAIDAAQANRRCELPDQVVGRWHEPCNGNAMDEPQQPELPGSCDQSLRDGDKAGQRQAGEQDPMGADTVGKVAEPGSKDHAGKARAREDSTGDECQMIRVWYELMHIDCEDRLHTGQGEMQDHRCKEQADYSLFLRQTLECFPQVHGSCCRDWMEILVQLRQCEEAQQAAGADQEERVPVANELGEPATSQRPHEPAGHLGRKEHAHRPAGAFLRRFLGNQRDGGSLKSAERALHEAQDHEVSDTLCETHTNHDKAQPGRSPEDHRLAAKTVRETAPDWGEDGQADKVAAKYNAGPAGNITRIRDAELGNIEWQDWRHLAHAD